MLHVAYVCALYDRTLDAAVRELQSTVTMLTNAFQLSSSECRRLLMSLNLLVWTAGPVFAVTITTESDHRRSVFLGELCICIQSFLNPAREKRECITERLPLCCSFNFVPFYVDVKYMETFFRVNLAVLPTASSSEIIKPFGDEEGGAADGEGE